jgi:hypothetical protein
MVRCSAAYFAGETFNAEIIEEIKGKTIPLHAWTCPEGSRRLKFPDFKTIGT